jgi:flavodoxin
MKLLIAYFSQTGNTEKVAKAIADSLENENRILARVNEVEDLESADVIFVGFPIMHHSVPGQAARLLQRIPAGKSVAFFATHGCLRGGKLAVEGFYHAVSMASNLHMLGSFGCQGKVDHHVLDELSHLPEYRSWMNEARSAVGHPDAADLGDARQFAALMLAMAHKNKS